MSEGVSHSRASITIATGWSVEETKALFGAWGATDVQSQLARNRRHTPAIDRSILTLIIIINNRIHVYLCVRAIFIAFPTVCTTKTF